MKPELILFNGVVRTQDDRLPLAAAVAVSNRRITAVGDSEIRKTAGRSTRVVDLEGRTVLPGMMDSHFHFYEWALNRRGLNLTDAASIDDVFYRVKTAAENRPPDMWIIGQGWNEADWPERRMPTRRDLDTISPNHPVMLWRMDLHLAAANSRVLELSGILDSGDIGIERDESGVPTGILRESGIQLVRNVMPLPADQEILESMKTGVSELHRLGLTGIHDVRLMGDGESPSALKSWIRLREAGHIDLRCWVALPREKLDETVSLGFRTGFGDSRLRIGHVKFFADGGMGAGTAWMIDPYLNPEYGHGMPMISGEELENSIRLADQSGLAVMVHAIGDRANHELIDIFERLKSFKIRHNRFETPISHRIEHVQMIRADDVSRLAKADVAACVQPHNLVSDMNMIDESVGDRGRRAYKFKSLLDSGIPVMFSSDTPVCDPNPFLGVHAAVTRQRTDGTPANGWYPEQRVSVDQAVKAYTAVPAEVHGVGAELGSVTPGKRADMIVIDRDIYTVPHSEIAGVKVAAIVFDGKFREF